MSQVLFNPQDFLELQKIIRDQGLLKRSFIYYTWKISSTFTLWVLGFVALYFVRDHLSLVLLVAAFLALVYGQISLIGHDAGHRQIFDSTKLNDAVLLPGTFLVGMSASSWMHKHNQHHAHPNCHDEDPDLEYPFIAFDECQVPKRSGRFEKFVVRHQAYLFPFLILPFPALSIKITGLKHILSQPFKKIWMDGLAYFGHYVLYLTMVFAILPVAYAIPFIVLHQILFGMYLGLIFAPNHKGMPMFTKDDKIDFLREQVLTSRNMYPHLVTDFIYGGLNYQIEHHLFPYMPRNKLYRARKIVKEFCAAKDIPYHETSVLGGLYEIWQHLREISRYAKSLGA